MNSNSNFKYIVIGIIVVAIIAIELVLILPTDSNIAVAKLPSGATLQTPGANKANIVPMAATTAPATTQAFTPTPQPTETPTPDPEPTATPDLTTAAPTPTTQPPLLSPFGAIIPTRLRIPLLGIDTTVEQVGKTKDGAMAVPSSYWTVGWYKLGAKPGELGNAVIAGHLDNPKGPSIFWDLKKLQPGSKIFVSDSKNHELTFEVYGSEYYPYDQAPLEKIFGTAKEVQLNLITCGGVFDQGSHNYDKRLVVYTRLVTNS